MSKQKNQTRNGPVEDFPCPDKLNARVTSLDVKPTVFGYDVFSDLAINYSFAEMIYLAMTGELPNRQIGQAFELVLKFLFPVSAAEAPGHVSILAQVCSGLSSTILSTTGITLVDMARQFVEDHEKLFVWLQSPTSDFPKQYCVNDAESREIVMHLQKVLSQINMTCDIFKNNPSLSAALIGIMYACGLKTAEQVQAIIVFAKYPCAVAEGFATAPLSFKEYPIRLPKYEYQKGSEHAK